FTIFAYTTLFRSVCQAPPGTANRVQTATDFKGLPVDSGSAGSYHSALMSAVLPEVVDAWRTVAARRRFEGTIPLARMPRLAEALADSQGECRYVLEFGRDPLGVAYLELSLDAGLPLTCQRSLERFVLG